MMPATTFAPAAGLLLVVSLLAAAPHAAGFAPSAVHLRRAWQPDGSCITSAAGLARRGCARALAQPAMLRTRMVLDPAQIDVMVTHTQLAGESLQHFSSHLTPVAVDVHERSGALLKLAAEIPDVGRASLSAPDASLDQMIRAVDIGPGSENLQRVLSTVVNTPGIRQVLQVVLPPIATLATGAIELALPSYMKALDVVSKTGGHEGLLPDGIDVTLKAVQRLASQGEILRAFKVLQAAWPTTKLRQGAVAAGLLGFYVLTPPGVFFGLFDIYIISPIDKLLETKWSGRDFTIGKQLGGGNFGTVLEATPSHFTYTSKRMHACMHVLSRTRAPFSRPRSRTSQACVLCTHT